ncbi:MAG: adenylate/guanylate cyclase domain-containing protein, partial [Thermodesulfobacteriota bacterium]
MREIKCPSCGNGNPPNHKFCYECGNRLGETDRPLKGETPKLEEPQSYIPKHLAEKILESKTRLEGERKQVSVLFADVSGFTALSETLDPEEVRSLMNQCLHLIIEQVHIYEGTINKFTGDGVMALFGAPIAQEDHAFRAVSAALGMQKSLRSYGDDLKEEGDIDFRMRIGINTGLVVVGSIGNDLSMEYTAMGDTVNLASRLEGLAEPGTIYVSESTYKLVKDYFEFKTIGEVRAKGKSQPILAYSPISQRARKGSFEICLERGLTKLVGRERELELLKDCLQKLKEEKGQIVCIIGEAGLGKSRMVHEFKSMCGDDEIEYLEGHCISYGKSFSYLPIIELLKGRFKIDENDDETNIKTKVESTIKRLNDDLKNSIPLILEFLSVKTDSEILENLEAEQKRQRFFDLIKTVLISENLIRPLIIIIEDLQWIDKTSEDFLSYLAGYIPNNQIMILCTARAEVVQGLAGRSYSKLITLTNLLDRECQMMIQSILSDGNVSEELTRLIIDRSEGNPFFIEAVTESLLEAGIIIKDGKEYSINKMISNLQVPTTIQDVIMSRIDRLDEKRKRILQVGSV